MIEFDDKQSDSILKSFYADETEDQARRLADKLGLPYADLRPVPFERDALELISVNNAQDWQILPFARSGQRLKVATVNPESNATRDYLQKLLNQGFQIEQYVVSVASLQKAWEMYREMDTSTNTAVGEVGIDNQLLVDLVSNDQTIDQVKKLLSENLSPGKRTTDLVELLVSAGIALGASDIHLEPNEESVQLRLRLDGVLQPILEYDLKTHERVLSRLKLLSGLKLNIKDAPQDGRYSISIGDREAEVRSSMMPGAFGESVVMRLLDPGASQVNIESLGMKDDFLEVVRLEVNKPNGLVLTTGPTGSGKSTALYSLLKDIYRPGIKIITIENPVEYHLEGIVQTQVNKDKGYDFYDGLRSALRQDPDVIMVGEIRDNNTAKTAVQASLTGHLVFSTLHTNDAVGAITRLSDLGVLPETLAPAINLVLAQRLVRRVVETHRQEIPLTDLDKQKLTKLFTDLDPKYWQRLIDRGTKFIADPEKPETETYHGRIGIFEAFVVDNKAQNLIRSGASTLELAKLQQTQGLPNLAQDAAIKALEGTTTFEEVARVISID